MLAAVPVHFVIHLRAWQLVTVVLLLIRIALDASGVNCPEVQAELNIFCCFCSDLIRKTAISSTPGFLEYDSGSIRSVCNDEPER